MEKRTNEIGALGEKKAAEYLRKYKYIIHTLNYRCPYGEIDIVAEKDGVIAFVEVKTRSGVKFGKPAEFVNEKKQARIYSAAQLYVYNNDIDLQPRFDVVEVYKGKLDDLSDATVNHIINAFQFDN